MTMLSAISVPGTVVRFLSELRANGSPIIRLVGSAAEGGTEALAFIEAEAGRAPEISQILADWHREAAEDLGGPALAFDEAAARFGATLLFRAAWCYLQRGLSREDVARLLNPPPGGPPLRTLALTAPESTADSPSHGSIPSGRSMPPALPPAAAAASATDFTAAVILFSADLSLRYLPAIFRMAQTLAPGDPLLGALQALAARFPLSGVGISAGAGMRGEPAAAAAFLPPPADDGALETILTHPGLRQLLLDRILATRASDWLHHPQIAEALQRTLGSHAHMLAPAFLPATPPLSLPPSDPPPAEQVV